MRRAAIIGLLLFGLALSGCASQQSEGTDPEPLAETVESATPETEPTPSPPAGSFSATVPLHNEAGYTAELMVDYAVSTEFAADISDAAPGFTDYVQTGSLTAELRNTTAGREVPLEALKVSIFKVYDAASGLCPNGPWLDDSQTLCALLVASTGFGGTSFAKEGSLPAGGSMVLFSGPSGGDYATALPIEVRVDDVAEGTDFTPTLNTPVAVVLRIPSDLGLPGQHDYWLTQATPCEDVTVLGSVGLCG